MRVLASASFLLALAVSVAASALPMEKRQGSAYPWCVALRDTCRKQLTRGDFLDFFEHDACLFGSACPPDELEPPTRPTPRRRNVQRFLQAVAGPNVEPPYAKELRVPDAILKQISTNDKTITRQNFIDGFYHALDHSNGPWPTNVTIIKEWFDPIIDWTAVCSGNIPLKNFADYFVYSSWVESVGNC
ncbi:hypothetical protein C8Q74DRAFT_1367712 [Fomes fomentarius]|nr:hypothetical protein C8Q74DRAFT_1367712 [Fomes fomentarius]